MTIKELRCFDCNKLLARFASKTETPDIDLEIKCSRCKMTNEFVLPEVKVKCFSVSGAKVIKPKDVK